MTGHHSEYMYTQFNNPNTWLSAWCCCTCTHVHMYACTCVHVYMYKCTLCKFSQHLMSRTWRVLAHIWTTDTIYIHAHMHASLTGSALNLIARPDCFRELRLPGYATHKRVTQLTPFHKWRTSGYIWTEEVHKQQVVVVETHGQTIHHARTKWCNLASPPLRIQH